MEMPAPTALKQFSKLGLMRGWSHTPRNVDFGLALARVACERRCMPKKPSPIVDTRFPQTGAPISREFWLEIWPLSKKGNEWVRAFDATYTLKTGVVQADLESTPPGEMPYNSTVTLTIVGPGGVRIDRTYEGNERDVKERIWPEGRDYPFLLSDFVDGVMA